MHFRAVPITERLPELWKWVTTIDSAGEHRVYRLVEFTGSVGLSWNMRDSAGEHSPNDNLPITHWLEEVIKTDVSKDWQTFRNTGLLLFVNQFLHIFNWSLTLFINTESGEVEGVKPIRTSWKGFSEEEVSEAYSSLDNFIKTDYKV